MRPGETVSHYEILAELGGGGMGVVFTARDLRLGRQVAIKFLSPEVLRDPNAKSRFVREARAASALEHPNICTIHDVDETADGHLFLVMALYEGETLRERIDRGPLRLGDALRIAAQVARGLGAAHAAGIVHRDIKPANVMLPRAGEAKILDFGLAKLAGSAQRLTRSGTTLGTLAYMAPEQARTGTVDARSDLWAVGVILYEMVTGRLPFEGEGDGVVLYSILERDPQPISVLRPGVAPEVEAVVARLLEKEPDDRFGDAAEAARELEGLATGQSLERTAAMPVAAPRSRSRGSHAVGVPSRMRRRARSRRRVAGAAAAALALLVATMVWLTRGSPRPSPMTTVAVLPFANFTGDASRDYLGDGLSALIIQELSAATGLSVAGRSETWAYRGRDKTSREIASDLGVAGIIEGQVLGSGNGLTLQLSVLDSANGMIRWSTKVAGTQEDLLDLASKASQRILAALAAEPTGRPSLAARQSGIPPSAASQEEFLRALQLSEEVDNPRRHDQAASLLRSVLERDPGFSAARAGLAEALSAIYARDREPALLEEAQEHARRARAEVPELLETGRALAHVLEAQGRSSDAANELQRLLAMHPRDDESFNQLAVLQRRAGQLAASETSIRQAIAVRPAFWRHWNELGTTLLEATDYDDAEAAFRRADELAPADISWARQNLANLALVRGDFAAAADWYEKLPEPISDPYVASNAGTAYYFTGRFEDAAERYRLATRLDPKEPSFHGNLGDALVKLRREAEAKREFLAAAAILAQEAPDDDASASLRELLYLAKAGRCAEATSRVGRLGAALPETAASAIRLARLYGACGDRERALDAVRSALQRGYPKDNLVQQPELELLQSDVEYRRLIGG